MQLVRATAGRDIDHRPGVAPVLGAVKAGQNLQLAQEFDTRRAIPVRSVVQLVHRRQAVHLQVVAAAPRAVDADAVTARAGVVGVVDGVDDAGRRAQNLSEVAGGQRN